MTIPPARILTRPLLLLRQPLYTAKHHPLARTLTTMPFASVQKAAPDPVQEVNKKVFADSNPRKVDLNQGVYRNEDGVYHEFRVLRKVCLPRRNCCSETWCEVARVAIEADWNLAHRQRRSCISGIRTMM